jgi:trigger factor
LSPSTASKLAADPKVTLPTEQGAIEELIAGKTDLNYTMALEIVPPITLGDFKTIKLTRLTADVLDAEVDQGLDRIVQQNRPYAPRASGRDGGQG